MEFGKEKTKLNALGKWTDEKYIRLFEFHETHPLLWKKNDADYMNNKKKKRTLNEIGKELVCSGEEVKLRFRSMKQTYQKNVQKMQKNVSAGYTTKPWRFAKNLSFLSSELAQCGSIDNMKVEQMGLNEQIRIENSTTSIPTASAFTAKGKRNENDENEKDDISNKFLQDEYDELGAGLAAILRRIGKINYKIAIDLELKWHAEGINTLKNLY